MYGRRGAIQGIIFILLVIGGYFSALPVKKYVSENIKSRENSDTMYKTEYKGKDLWKLFASVQAVLVICGILGICGMGFLWEYFISPLIYINIGLVIVTAKRKDRIE